MGDGRSPWIPDWFEEFYANTPGGRAEEAQAPGTVPFSPVGQPEPRAYGIDYVGQQLGGIGDFLGKSALNVTDALGRFFGGRPGAVLGEGLGDRAYSTTPKGAAVSDEDFARMLSGEYPDRGTWTGQRDYPQPGSPFYTPGAEEADREYIEQVLAQRKAEEEAANQPAPTDWLAEAIAYQNQFAPDYSSLGSRWSDEAAMVNAQIQAMYDQIASRAGENVERIQDIYGNAQAGIGAAYDTGTGNVEDAYSSAQQQAADQMARLGIEAAAPNVINPMALSQAESVAGLEAGRAAGLGATERYGASSGDFASQMAQVAQQEGAGYQTSVADALRRQLMNLEMQQQQEAYQRAMQAPGLANDLFQASQLGQPQSLSFEQELALEEFAYRRGKDAAEMAARSAGSQMDYFTKRLEQRADPDVIYAEIEELIQRGLLF
jgi:hypothetical protein